MIVDHRVQWRFRFNSTAVHTKNGSREQNHAPFNFFHSWEHGFIFYTLRRLSNKPIRYAAAGSLLSWARLWPATACRPNDSDGRKKRQEYRPPDYSIGYSTL